MAKVKLIDEKGGIYEIIDREEDYYFDVGSIKRVNRLKIDRCRTLDSEIRAMIEDVEDAKALIKEETMPKDLQSNFEEVDKLVGLAGGGRVGKIIQHRLHRQLSSLRAKILRRDYLAGKIVHKKIPTRAIAREYTAPLPDEFDYAKEYIKEREIEKEESIRANKQRENRNY